MAFGEIKLSYADFWEMDIREFICAWQGYIRSETERLEGMRDIVFSAARYNSANTANVMAGKKAAKQIASKKFNWEKSKLKSKDPGEPLSYDDVKGLFNMISN